MVIEKGKKFNKLKLTNFVKVLGLNSVNELFISGGILTEKLEIANDTFNINAKDCIIAPGFVDPQINGLGNCNFWANPSFAEIDNLRLQLAFCGVVAFCPTIITAPKDKIISSIDHINSYIKQSSTQSGARILGIHVEGIFITKYGVHDEKYVQSELTIKNIEPFVKENVVLYTLAPELDKAGEAIKFLQKNNILVSIGHSNATFEEGEIAIEKFGLKTATHMFNSMKGVNGFSHRGNSKSNIKLLESKLENNKNIDPKNDGIMLSLLKNKDVLCMVIADGVHVDRDVVGFLKNYKDMGHFALASDIVSSDFYNFAKLKGTLGGGQNNLDSAVSNLINWKVSNVEDSLSSASKPIANQLKVAKGLALGGIAFNKEANLVLWDTKKNCVRGTIIGENVFLNY